MTPGTVAGNAPSQRSQPYMKRTCNAASPRLSAFWTALHAAVISATTLPSMNGKACMCRTQQCIPLKSCAGGAGLPIGMPAPPPTTTLPSCFPVPCNGKNGRNVLLEWRLHSLTPLGRFMQCAFSELSSWSGQSVGWGCIDSTWMHTKHATALCHL